MIVTAMLYGVAPSTSDERPRGQCEHGGSLHTPHRSLSASVADRPQKSAQCARAIGPLRLKHRAFKVRKAALAG